MMTRDDCVARDARTRWRRCARSSRWSVSTAGLIYLDGNSLGVLPRAAADRVQEVIEDEWGAGLIRSWNTAGWITLSHRIGDKIARADRCGAGEVVVADSTSVNLYKVLSAAILS